MRRGRFWTDEEDAVLRQRYANEPTARIAADLGRSVGTCYQRAYALGLLKSDDYLSSPNACRLRCGDGRGTSTRFQKGQAPPNKGLRRPGWHRGRMKETQYVKGNQTSNHMPVGATRIIGGYVYRKVSDVRLVP